MTRTEPGRKDDPERRRNATPRISAVLITLDAERTLERTLESLAWVDEVVIVDSGSTDATERIARDHGARFLVREWPGYGIQKGRAAAEAGGDWILSVDADEVVSDQLAASIRAAVREPDGHVALKMARHTRFLGAWLGGRGWWTDWKLRLFRADRGRFNEARIHEGVSVDGPIGFLEGPLLHRPWRDVAHRLEKENRYSTLSAQRDYRRGRRAGALRPFVRAVGWFIKEYVVRGGFLHGQAGFLHAGLSGAYAFHRAVKLHELTRAEGGEAGRDPTAPERRVTTVDTGAEGPGEPRT